MRANGYMALLLGTVMAHLAVMATLLSTVLYMKQLWPFSAIMAHLVSLISASMATLIPPVVCYLAVMAILAWLYLSTI